MAVQGGEKPRLRDSMVKERTDERVKNDHLVQTPGDGEKGSRRRSIEEGVPPTMTCFHKNLG